MGFGLAQMFLLAASLAFAWSIGAHYTGACMGMAYAARSITLRRALILMAPLAFVGAVVASGAVEVTVGSGLLSGGSVGIPVAGAIIVSAFALTSAYNFVRLPTSTIQILVFAVVGAGVASGVSVNWGTVARLAVVWAAVPPAAAALAFLLTRLADATRMGRRLGSDSSYLPAVGLGLVAAGAGASFVMGANDVSNASGALVMTGLFGLLPAAALGGIGLSVGVLTWGRPILQRVAFETVKLDRLTASLSQLVQSILVLVPVLFGYFTSLNQALLGAMAGAGYARGRATVNATVLYSILLGWAVGPASGFGLAFVVVWAGRSVGVLP